MNLWQIDKLKIILENNICWTGYIDLNAGLNTC